MNDQLNIPQGIKNYGPGGVKADESIIDEKEFLEKLPEVAKNAIADACTGSTPRQPNQEEMEKLLKACYYDTEIDFWFVWQIYLYLLQLPVFRELFSTSKWLINERILIKFALNYCKINSFII